MSELTVEFDGPKPSTIAVRSVQTQSLTGLQVPEKAIKFHFTRTKRGRLPKIVSPFYFLSLEPLVLNAEEAIARRLEDASSVLEWRRDYGAKEFGVVAWQEGASRRSMLVPLTSQIVILDRLTMSQVWPMA